ncbi:MAG: M20/M25/M40 family metallo-hydrolase [Treponema sp.]|jgi:carboxypeptidase PM20D1|nr:M20/M25/M40 family metallo-hydrolase [Treponema sp.]
MEKEGAIERFRRAIRIRTDWPENVRGDNPSAEALEAAEGPLRAFQDFLDKAYPCFSRVAERRVLSPYSLVYRWPGGASSEDSGGKEGQKTADAPEPEGVLILAHYDVVPVEADKWSTDPFGAEVKEGFMYGRGTQDMKGSLIAVMEAAEELVIRGFRPRQDIWFAFGGDEERSGLQGARNTAAWFAGSGRSQGCGQGRRFSWVLDEGSSVTINQIRGISTPLALFGIEEKGFLSLELAVDQKPGHSSRPPRVQAAVLLARALLRISRRPFPARLSPVVAALFSLLAGVRSRERGGALRPRAVAFRTRLLNILAPLAAPILTFTFRRDPQFLALLHTTVAMTQLEGSAADNVMPSRVRAVINLRLLAPWTVDDAINYITWAVGDERVKLRILGSAFPPVPACPEHGRMAGPGWDTMTKAAAAVFPDAIPLPFIMTAATDSRHYRDLAGGIFRFSPMRLSPADMSSVHGHDERISLENFFLAIRFYTALFELL